MTEKTSVPGVYIVLFELNRDVTVSVGRLGPSKYPGGYYAYVGSALSGLAGRIRHHLMAHQRPFWHIDYLLPRGRLQALVIAVTTDRLECTLAKFMAERCSVFSGFGSSDCRCPGHLFYRQGWEPLLRAARNAVKAAGCEPKLVANVSDEATPRATRPSPRVPIITPLPGLHGRLYATRTRCAERGRLNQ